MVVEVEVFVKVDAKQDWMFRFFDGFIIKLDVEFVENN